MMSRLLTKAVYSIHLTIKWKLFYTDNEIICKITLHDISIGFNVVIK